MLWKIMFKGTHFFVFKKIYVLMTYPSDGHNIKMMGWQDQRPFANQSMAWWLSSGDPIDYPWSSHGWPQVNQWPTNDHLIDLKQTNDLQVITQVTG